MASKKGGRRAQVQAALDSWFDAGPVEKAEPKKKPTRKTRRAGEGASKKKQEGAPAAASAPRPDLKVVPPPAASPQKKKVQATFQLPPELLEEARDTVVALAGPPESLTLATLVARGIERELQALRKKHNDGERFPSRQSPLRQGRPIGS